MPFFKEFGSKTYEYTKEDLMHNRLLNRLGYIKYGTLPTAS